jgi:dynein heavy chain 1
MNQLINLVLGEGFMNDHQIEMGDIVDTESSAKSPILLCSAPGFDPSFKVESLSKERSIRLIGVAIGS